MNIKETVLDRITKALGNYLSVYANKNVLNELCDKVEELQKIKDIKKNIVFPDLQMYNSFLAKSLEEFGLETTFVNLLNQYNFFKKSKTMYRLSIDKFDL